MFILYFLSTLSHSCGYRKAFEEYSNILIEKYPQIAIHGANYDPPNMGYLAKLCTFIKFAFILAIICSYDPWVFLGRPVPAWFAWCQENKMYAGMMVFFVGNMIEGQVTKMLNKRINHHNLSTNPIEYD